MNTVTGIYSAPRQHWVGDGFPVRSMFSYNGHGKQLSPSCCSTMQALPNLRPARVRPASVRTRIAALKR